jgi:hypothetical protein
MNAFLRTIQGLAPLPSTDLFFLNACGHRVTPGWGRGVIMARGSNCFVHGDAMLLVRRDTPEVMRAALAWPGRLAYVVDDDIAGAAHSPGLPDGYRQRLAEFNQSFHQALIRRADLLLAASDALAERFAGNANVLRIDPCWTMPFADERHFAELGAGGELRLSHLGSGSHSGGLAAIAPAVTALLGSDPATSFTYFAAESVTAALEAHPRAYRLHPKAWPGYRRWLAAARFHLALYPLTASRFDRARSNNKLFEHAIVGAVGIYPRDWPAIDAAAGSILAPSDPGDWAEALAAATARRSELAGLAAAAALSLSRRNTMATQRALWSDFFGMDF